MSLSSNVNALAAAVRDKINAMVGRLLPAGGTTGQVLQKASGTDYATEWADPSGGGLADAPSDGRVYARSDAAWVPLPEFITKVTTADDTRTSNALAADATLQQALEANSVYRFELLLLFTGGVAEDFRFRIARTSLGDAELRFASDLDNASAPTLTWNSTTNCAVAAAGTLYMGNYIGLVRTGASTGTLVFEWAQQTTGATAAVLKAGSMLMLRKVA